MHTGRAREVKKGQPEMLGIKGCSGILKLYLMEVNDSGIVLSPTKDGLVERKFYFLEDIVSIKRISALHTFFRIYSGAYLCAGVFAVAATGVTAEKSSDYIMIPVLVMASIPGLIPFWIHRNDLYLGEKWKLVIR